jgi:hypothetical protein
MQAAILKQHREKYPDKPELQPDSDELFAAPPITRTSYDHFVNFFESVRTAQAERRGRGVQLPGRGAGAAHQRQLLRRPARRLGSGSHEASDSNGRREPAMKRAAAALVIAGHVGSDEHGFAARHTGHMAVAVRRQDDLGLARVSGEGDAGRLESRRRRAHSGRPGGATSLPSTSSRISS